MNRSRTFSLTLLFFIVSMMRFSTLHAGAYVFSGEANGVDLISHPTTYTGSGGNIVVRVCIDPGSPSATEMEIPVQNNINIFNRLEPVTENLKQGSSNNLPSDAIDLESVALHEIGHCLGLAHVNAASESGLSSPNIESTKATDGTNNGFDINAGADNIVGSSDDIRGDDVNLHWFRKSNNNPFTIDSVIDKSTYSVDVADLPAGHSFPANGTRDVSAQLGFGSTEAVMQQGTYFDEAQRTLTHDDVATLKYAASGVDESAGNNDDYTLTLEYGGISTTDCDVTLAITTTTGLAFCSVSGAYVGPPTKNHIRVTNASIEFGSSFNWYFNTETVNQEPVLSAIGDQTLLENDTLNLNLFASDTDDNDAISYSVAGLPAFAILTDNTDGTASLVITPLTGDVGVYPVTVTVTDNGLPNLSHAELFNITVTVDTDGDGLTDNDEINIYFTNPNSPHSDTDSLTDYEEVITYLTDPNDADSDNDGFDDGIEVNNGSNPNDINSWPTFADGDLAPLSNPDGIINAADLLIMQRIVAGDLAATPLEYAHGDLYPAGAPDAVIDVSDLLLLQQLVLP